MKSVVVDKVASVTQACGLGHELRISTDIPCEEGVVLVVEILNNKSTYNTLELTSGRMAKVARGDIVVGALGHRKALFGYSGHLPSRAGGRCDPVTQHRRCAGDLRLGNPRQGQTLRLPRAGRRPAVSLPRRAHRRAGARRFQAARLQCAAQHAGHPSRRTRGYLHGGRKNRRGLRDRLAHATLWARLSMPSRRPVCRCVATFSRWKTRARAGQ